MESMEGRAVTLIYKECLNGLKGENDGESVIGIKEDAGEL